MTAEAIEDASAAFKKALWELACLRWAAQRPRFLSSSQNTLPSPHLFPTPDPR